MEGEYVEFSVEVGTRVLVRGKYAGVSFHLTRQGGSFSFWPLTEGLRAVGRSVRT